jgi:hypothetical protein
MISSGSRSCFTQMETKITPQKRQTRKEIKKYENTTEAKEREKRGQSPRPQASKRS